MDDLSLEFSPTSLGWLAVVASGAGLRWVSLACDHESLWRQIAKRFPETRWEGPGSGDGFHQGRGVPDLRFRRWLQAVERAVEQPARAGKAPFDISGTPFQHAVWDALCQIPAGTVWTYGELAAHLGRPRAFRAVGSACGANPVPFLIPCHRVVGSHGGLGGFGLGLEVKRALLAREGVRY